VPDIDGIKIKTVMRRWFVAAGLAAMLLPAAAAARSDDKVVGRASASGDFAIALAHASVVKPAAILVAVKSSPLQAVSGNWTLVCSKGLGAGSKSGRFSGTTPLVRLARLPMRGPDRCTVAAGSQLSHGGRITVQILRR
jgi:hypothetical protein